MNQSAGLYEYIDDNYVLAGCKSNLGLRDTTSEDSYLRDKINYCLIHELKNFGTQSYIITQIQIDHTGNPRAKLPQGFIRFVKQNPIVYVNANGQATYGTNSTTIDSTVTTANGTLEGSIAYTGLGVYGYNNYSAPSFVNNTFYKNTPYTPEYTINGTVTIQDGYLYFSTDVIADYVKIAYLGAYVGDNGKVVIPAYCEGALVNYACSEWCNTQFLISGEQKFKIMANDFFTKYARAKAKAKVFPLMPDSEEYRLINYYSNQLI